MSADRFVELNQTVKDLCEKVNMLRAQMDRTYRAYRTTPSATNFGAMSADMALFQNAYQRLSDAREMRREFLKDHGMDVETFDAGDGRRVTIPAE